MPQLKGGWDLGEGKNFLSSSFYFSRHFKIKKLLMLQSTLALTAPGLLHCRLLLWLQVPWSSVWVTDGLMWLLMVTRENSSAKAPSQCSCLGWWISAWFQENATGTPDWGGQTLFHLPTHPRRQQGCPEPLIPAGSVFDPAGTRLELLDQPLSLVLGASLLLLPHFPHKRESTIPLLRKAAGWKQILAGSMLHPLAIQLNSDGVCPVLHNKHKC